MAEAEVVTLWGGEAPRTPYLTRVILGRFRLHVFHRGDADPDHHDHPADFWTFPLVSYVEEIDHPWSRGHTLWRVVRAFRLHRRRAEFSHRVLGRWTGQRWEDGTPRYDTGQIATLVWWGRKRREWGFWTSERGWVPWRVYLNEPLPTSAASQSAEGVPRRSAQDEPIQSGEGVGGETP
jgi:hypothetical protein